MELPLKNKAPERLLAMELVILLVSVSAAFMLGGWLNKRPAPPEPEVRSFGLKEARAAREFIKTTEQAKAVKAVVVGVLSFEDTVAEEAEDAAGDLLQAQGSNNRRIDGYLEDIVVLNSRITSLQDENLAIGAQRGDLEDLKSLFS